MVSVFGRCTGLQIGKELLGETVDPRFVMECIGIGAALFYSDIETRSRWSLNCRVHRLNASGQNADPLHGITGPGHEDLEDVFGNSALDELVASQKIALK